MSVIGIDPGHQGAMATFDYVAGTLDIRDMPVWEIKLSNKKRRWRVDPIELLEFFEYQKLAGAELAIIEAVGGRPRQGASAGFTFGYGVGLIYMACVAAKLPIDTVTPQTWKKIMQVPGKAVDGSDEAIIARACEVFPESRDLFYGVKGGKRVDRAEAALLAKYAATHSLRLAMKVGESWSSIIERSAL